MSETLNPTNFMIEPKLSLSFIISMFEPRKQREESYYSALYS